MKALRSRLMFVTLSVLVLCILFAAAIPLLCLSAGKNTALMIVSIVVLGIGLPGIPLMWVWFAKLVTLRSIAATIEEDRIYEVSVIAARLHLSRQQVDRRIRRILRWRFLREYTYNGQFVRPGFHLGASAHCDHCGANFAFSENVTECPHCGAPYEKK